MAGEHVYERKAVPLADYELRAGTDGWQFTAYASTFGNRDHTGDIIQKGAFRDTLTDPDRDRPLLWQHLNAEPIGKELSLREDSRGLLGSWEIVDTQRGSDAYKLLKKGVVRSMSIGYFPKDWELADGGETRVLKGIDLLENSVVSIPANDQARVVTVKAADPAVPFEDLMAQIRHNILLGAEEAEALAARRVEEERKLAPAHIDALTLLEEELKGSLARVTALLSAHRPVPSKDPSGAEAALVLLALRRARARSRAAWRTIHVDDAPRVSGGD